jgi:hypothetical protein
MVPKIISPCLKVALISYSALRAVLALRTQGVLMMINKVVASLRKEYSRLEKEMGQVGKALDALGHAGGRKLKRMGRSLSKDARRRIAEAQKLRWAKVRKAAAKLAKS